jgi:uncharacterized protein YycO
MFALLLYSILLHQQFTPGLNHLNVKDGDIIFQTSRSSQSKAVQLATKSSFSHMGIVLLRDGKPQVLEAASRVKFTPLQEWIRRGEGHHFVIKRLVKRDSVFTSEALVSLNRIADTFVGRPYDSYFGWSDERLYCSELVWKIYQGALGIELGKLRRLKDFDLSSQIVKEKIRERYGSKIPLMENVIAPEGMFRSGFLVTIYESK